MNQLNALWTGWMMGFFLSMIPGPAGTVILQDALNGRRRTGARSIFGMLGADLVIFTVVAMGLGFFAGLTANPGFRIAAGLFFVIFAVRAWLGLGAEASRPSRSSTFILTLLNPAAWIGAVAFLGLGFPIFGSVAGLELGGAAWFILTLAILPRFSITQRKVFEKAAIILVGILGFWFVIRPTVAHAEGFECREVLRVHQSVRRDCTIATDRGSKVLHVLELRGSFAQISYDQGYLLAEQVENGVFSETLWRIQKGLGHSPVKKAIFECYLHRIQNSVSKEFLRGVRGLSRGVTDRYRELGLKRKYSDQDILEASLGVELSNVAEGLSRNIEEDPVKTLAGFSASCGFELPIDGAKDLVSSVAKLGLKLKRGCLGFVVSDETTGGNGMYHARNLDADLMKTWNSAPTLFLIQETGMNRYAAMATAGDVYPGGISGLNEHGISVSLHQMSTQKYRSQFWSRRGVMAPFLQQRILREARTVDEAIELIRSSGHFGAWTSLISDAKTGEVASVEFSGKRVQVARRVRNQSLGQSNHFLGSAMQDQFFTYNFNKQLESESRLQVIESELAQALELRRTTGTAADVEWVIDHLAGHQDAFEGFRSFGRTATKAYTVMSTIVNAARGEVWLTLGERLPASHSHFLGFKVDWDNLRANPIRTSRVTRFAGLPNWEASLGRYVEAFVQYEEGNRKQSIAELDEAIRLAALDGIAEYPYYFMRARVYGELGLWEEATLDWMFLEQHLDQLHAYGRGLVELYLAVSNRELSREDVLSRLSASERLLSELQISIPHFDLKRKLNLISKLKKGESPKLPEIEFVTVE